MADPSQQKTSHGDVDHGLGDVDALFVVAYEPTPSGHPGKGALDGPAPRQGLEAFLPFHLADDFDNEVEEDGLVHKLGAVIAAIGEQMLEPWPAVADGVEDHLRHGAVGEIGGCKVHHQKPPVRIDSKA